MPGSVFLPCYLPGAKLWFGEGNGNPLQYPCLENPMDRGVWWATVHGVTRVGHELVTKPPPLNYGGGNEDNGHLLQEREQVGVSSLWKPALYMFTKIRISTAAMVSSSGSKSLNPLGISRRLPTKCFFLCKPIEKRIELKKIILCRAFHSGLPR